MSAETPCRVEGAALEELAASYRWSRSTGAAAFDGGNDDAFAAFRTATVAHRSELRRLASPGDEIAGRVEALDRLVDLLDEDHALDLLGTGLDAPRACADHERHRLVLRELIAERRQALRAMARPLARRLFADPPSTFRRWLRRPPALTIAHAA